MSHFAFSLLQSELDKIVLSCEFVFSPSATGNKLSLLRDGQVFADLPKCCNRSG
jgi:hypothetical protein